MRPLYSQGRINADFKFSVVPFSLPAYGNTGCQVSKGGIKNKITYSNTPPLWTDLVKILTRKPDMPHLFPWNALISKNKITYSKENHCTGK